MDNIRRCVYFNNYPYIKQTGELRFCCKNPIQTLGYFGNIKENTLREMYDNALFLSYRDKMASGEELPGCNICYDSEKVSDTSFRIRAMGHIIQSSGLKEPPQDRVIRGLDLRVGNTCNLKCLMCHPSDSNSWYKIHEEFSKYVHNSSQREIDRELTQFAPEKLDWAEHESSWQNIFCSIDDNVRLIYISGGEPFYLKNFEVYMSELVDRCGNAKFSINSNATRMLPEKYSDKFKKYNIDLRVSMDGIGQVDEFIRQGTVWEEKVEVIRQYNSMFSNLTFDVTLSSLNIKHLPELVNWVFTNYPKNKIFLRPVVNRKALQIELVPMKDRIPVIEFLSRLTDNPSIMNVDQILSILSRETIIDGLDKMERTIKFFNMNGDVFYEEIDRGLADYAHKHSSS